MYSAIASAWALLLGMALIMLGNGLQGTLLGVRATLEGFPTTVTGLVMTGYFAGFLAGSILSPGIVGRVGHIRVFAALASLASASALAHAVFVDPWSWGAMRLVTGFSFAGLYVVAESWLNDRATNETRGQVLSIYMVVAYGGMTLGQLLLNLADPGGFVLFVLISVLVSLALVPISLTASPAPAFDAPSRVSLWQLYRISPLGVIGGLATGVANGMVFGMGAVYARAAGMSVTEVSLFMGLVLLGGMVLQWPIGQTSDWLDRRKVIVVLTALATALCLLLALHPSISTHGRLGLVFLLGGMILPMYSLFGAHLNDHLEPSQMVAANSGYVLINGLGASLGPVSVSFAMTTLGPDGFFWALSAVLGFILAFTGWRMTQSAAVPAAERSAFVAMPPRTTPIAGALNPEVPEDAADWEDLPDTIEETPGFEKAGSPHQV
ncbi:MAG: MFS transporter [Rhodospirillales bacterium]|nr:MAG: MFS transporter [Rhodospirillales bacterium]